MKIVIVPIGNVQDILDPKDAIKAINNALTATSEAIRVDFRVTTQTWKHKPKFTIAKSGEFERTIATRDDVYRYVNNGTRPHKIRAKNSPYLRFQTGYNAKTTPRVVASKSGGAFGAVVYRQEVNHPGTKGRHFDDEIAKKWRREWGRNLQRSILAAMA